FSAGGKVSPECVAVIDSAWVAASFTRSTTCGDDFFRQALLHSKLDSTMLEIESNTLIVRWRSDPSSSPVLVGMYDMLGRLIAISPASSNFVGGGVLSFDVSALPRG